MSSFFTAPASQRKRKREDTTNPSSGKRRNTNGSAPNKVKKYHSKSDARDESISGSGTEDDTRGPKSDNEELDVSTESDEEDETGAERRLRLAEKYLENIKGGVDEIGYDAAEIDRDLIAERLQEDVAESKGRLYRHIAGDLDFLAASKTLFRTNTLTTTSIALCPPYVYTVSKDMSLIKWELKNPPRPSKKRKPPKNPPPPLRRRPVKICYTRGNKKNANDQSFKHHTGHILTVAASSSGKFVATGGSDKRLIIWSATDLTPLRVFTQHRDAVTSLAFRRGTHQLYSSSKDRTIKTWSLDELAYVETLFGHQDEVVDLAALAQERCVSVGARDRTARLWKVAEETQLVFRGGGGGGRNIDEKNRRSQGLKDIYSSDIPPRGYLEGSIDRVALIDEETFITGSDNGALSLWTLHKKKPVFTVPLAHGLDPPLSPSEASAEEVPDPKVPGIPQPRWITALATVPYSDLILSGSWDGWVRVWKVSADKKRIERVGVLGGGDEDVDKDEGADAVFPKRKAFEEDGAVKGVVNDIDLFERGDRGQDGVCVVVAMGKEHRLGKWKRYDGNRVEGRNDAVVFEVPRAIISKPAKDEVLTGGEGGREAGQGEKL